MEFITFLGRQLPVYGLCVLAGIALATMTVPLRRSPVPLSSLFIALACGLAGLLVGAKLLYIVTVAPELWRYRREIMADPAPLAALLKGGFVFFGGLAGAVGAVAIFCRIAKLRFLMVLDALIPCAAIGQAAGRVGCFLVGCCHGVECHGPLCVVYGQGARAPAGVPLFPVQLVEAAALVIVYGALMLLGRRREGVPTGLYLVSCGVCRFVLEFFRGDVARGFLFGLSTSQWIALLMVPLGAALLLRQGRKIQVSSNL